MRIQKKHLSTAIALALTLTMAIAMMAALPAASGQGEIGREKIRMSAASTVVPNPIGVGQVATIQTMIYPTPITPGDIYYDLNYTIRAPNGTIVDQFLADTNQMAEYDFTYVADVSGTWRCTFSWDGDDDHFAVSRTQSWTVQDAPVSAQGKVDTTCGVSTSPKTYLQVGNPIYIIGFITPPRELSGGLYPNITFTITLPSGQTETEFFYYTNSEATRSFSYLPEATGTYSVTMSYPGYNFQKGDTSVPWTFIVQEEAPTPGSYWTPPPLPSGPWGYPIDAQNRDWWPYSGAWTNVDFDSGGRNWQAYVKAPRTPHVLYKVQTSEAGLIGGEWGGYGVQLGGLSGPAVTIEGKSSQFVEAHGRVYYAQPRGQSDLEDSYTVLFCRDLYTGEIIYEKQLPGSGTSTSIWMAIDTSLGKVDPKTGVSVSGRFNLWLSGGGRMLEIDPWTGNVVTSYDRTGTFKDMAIYFNNYNGTSGESQSGVMTKWDTRTEAVVWVVAGIGGTAVTDDGYIYRLSRSTGGIPIGEQLRSWNATTGELIAEGPVYSFTSSDSHTVGYGMVYQHCLDRRVHALSLATGQEVWVSEPMEAPWGVWSSYGNSCGDGMVFFDSFDGYEYGYDAFTGETKFKVFTENTTETAMGHWGTWSQCIIGDGLVYFSCGEHAPPNPLPAGGPLICADMATGEKLWTIHGFYNKAGVTNYGFLADGVLGYECLNDGSIWMIGRGPSETTISGPEAIALGESVTLEGSVTDQASGITSYGWPVKGTACVSDDSMPKWTEYLYTGQPQPMDATGVPVWLFAMTEDGSIVDITHVTTDINGHYAYTWTPPEEGTYKVFASFEGTESYYDSIAQSAVGVGPAPAAPAAPEAAADNTMLYTTVIGVGVAIIIAVAIVGILILRKRP
jgi:hypothetical protein